jgi:hypothetical protein
VVVIKNRYELAYTLQRGAVCAEIGVEHGGFSELLLERTVPRELHLIDSWSSTTTKFQKKQDFRYVYVLNRFKKEILEGRVLVHKQTSESALGLFPDEFFDWVYLDGSVDPVVVHNDIFGYFKKVKNNGRLIVAGYSDNYKHTARYKTVQELLSTNPCASIIVTTPHGKWAGHCVISKSRTEPK